MLGKKSPIAEDVLGLQGFVFEARVRVIGRQLPGDGISRQATRRVDCWKIRGPHDAARAKRSQCACDACDNLFLTEPQDARAPDHHKHRDLGPPFEQAQGLCQILIGTHQRRAVVRQPHFDLYEAHA